MSFETDIKKLQKQWENTQDNQITIDVTRQNLGLQNENIVNLQPNIQDFKNIVYGSGGWQNVSLLADLINAGGLAPNIPVVGYQWVIKVTNFPISWIPLARINIGYNYPFTPAIGNIGDPADQANIQWFSQIAETNNTNTDLATVNFYVTFASVTNTQDFTVRLYLVFLNPSSML